MDDVGIVAPEIDERAARIVPEIAIGEMRAQRVVRPLGRRAQPEFVIEFGRRSSVGWLAQGLQAGGK